MKRFQTHKLPISETSFEISSAEIKTIPGQVLSVRNILENHRRGIGIGSIQKKAFFDEEYDPTRNPDFDLSDATSIVEEMRVKRNKQIEAEQLVVEPVKVEPTEPVEPASK